MKNLRQYETNIFVSKILEFLYLLDCFMDLFFLNAFSPPPPLGAVQLVVTENV